MNSKQAFVEWVKVNDPFLYTVGLKRAELDARAGMGSFMDVFTSIASVVKDVAPQVLQLSAQRKILNVQLKRAGQGLPPLQTAEYAPTVNVSAQVTPEMEQAATRVAVQSTQAGITQLQPLILGGLGLVAVYLFIKARK